MWVSHGASHGMSHDERQPRGLERSVWVGHGASHGMSHDERQPRGLERSVLQFTVYSFASILQFL